MNFSGKNHLNLKTGEEQFNLDNENLGFTLLDFWKWSVSDILSNATRGVLAEIIVAKALNADMQNVRSEWDAYDLLTPNAIKVEVKSSAYLQSWEQKKHSSVQFSIRLAKPWSFAVEDRSEVAVRSADVYVFALLNHMDKETVNPLNLNQWEFYVCSTRELNDYPRSQHSITLNSLRKLTKTVYFSGLNDAVNCKMNNDEI